MADARMAGDYEIINAVHMGDKEIVLGVNMNAPDGCFYLVSDYERNELFEKYDNGIVSNDYIEVAQIFIDRLKEQIEKVKATTKDIPRGIITADMCENISDKNLENEIIVIRADVLYPEHQTQANQIVRCTGGNGARPNSLGTAVFCTHLSNNEKTRFERYDIQGILKKECYPEWLTKRLEFENAIKDNKVFEYGGYHFLPVGEVNKSKPFEYIARQVATDKSLGLWGNEYTNHYGKNKVDYKHKEFYKACNDIPCDIFKCIENGKVYLPSDHELFEYTGEYEAYTEKPRTKPRKDKGMER